ncbi:MAG: hypothetical protein QM619_13965 [Micropruina sp.]|uniref:hypothetical protein n=1 Tax=Micropruina sp. TaxID=2737536 RepID=UPI0039E69149
MGSGDLKDDLEGAAMGDYLDEATQGLQSSPLYVSVQVRELGADQQNLLRTQLGGGDIAVVVLPGQAATEITDMPQFLADLAARTGYDTVLVSVGGDLSAGSRALPAGQAAKLADAAEGGSLYYSLSGFITQAKAGATTTVTVQQPPSAAPDAFPLGLVGGIGVAAAVAAAVVVTLRRRRRGPHLSPRHTPDQVTRLLVEIRHRSRQISDRQVAELLDEAEHHVQELFQRVPKRIPDQLQQITARYKVTLETVRNVVERFEDIEDHPRYFRDAAGLLQDGRRALEQYCDGVVQNIQEIEEGSLTEFRVDTKILQATASPERKDLR